MKCISVNVKQPTYTIINTSKYNNDGNAIITVCKIHEFNSIEFSLNDI